ncbi:MAG: hypothetical protein JXR96_25600 [Deltaproteobacteria bacterium]|nr:hypothetical protein [Deltaproteobacteria bacterium]
MKQHLLLFVLCPLLLAGSDAMNDGPALEFENPAHRAFFTRAKGCIDALHADWRRHPFETLGNFYQAKWCRGKGARSDCQIASGTADRRDQLAVRLFTLFYGKRFPQVFGYGLQFLKTPESVGWGVNFSFHIGGKTVVGESFNLQFRRYPRAEGDHDLLLYVGSGAEYEVGRSPIRLFASPDELRASLLRDAASLQAGALAQLAALEARVLSALEGDEVETCDWGKYEGDGIPPPCHPRKLSAQERAAELAKARAYFSARKRAWKTEGPRLWKLLSETAPLTCLWPAP